MERRVTGAPRSSRKQLVAPRSSRYTHATSRDTRRTSSDSSNQTDGSARQRRTAGQAHVTGARYGRHQLHRRSSWAAGATRQAPTQLGWITRAEQSTRPRGCHGPGGSRGVVISWSSSGQPDGNDGGRRDQPRGTDQSRGKQKNYWIVRTSCGVERPKPRL